MQPHPDASGQTGHRFFELIRQWGSRLAIVLVAVGALAACATKLQRTLVQPGDVATLDRASKYLKAHLRDGSVYVLSEWGVRENNQISGTGELRDANRALIASGSFVLPRDSIVLYETNVVKPSGPSTALTVMTGITAAIAVACLANPKACFGSCPTFYARDSTGAYVLQAEGFSASVAPSLEATDLDMLYRARPADRKFSMRVTNEAFETHVIRHADILAVRRPAGGRIFVTPAGEFYATSGLVPAASCRAKNGDCSAALSAYDGNERFSLTDSTDLAARETIDLVFDSVAPGEVGVVISSRQTLVTTFLIYQGLAYLGTEAGRFIAAFENSGGVRERALGLGRALGQIEVLAQDASGEWVVAGRVGETGPIAVDTKVVPVTVAHAGKLNLRLRLTQGLWRIDQVALTRMTGRVEPQRVPPAAVRRDGRLVPAALRALTDPAQTLVTLPGDEYDIEYVLPERPETLDLFLDARGYYLEWMRTEWLAEQNPQLAASMMLDPAGALKRLAPVFKRGEAQMEHAFWNSRYVAR